MDSTVTAVFIGQPAMLEDERGPWRSSIRRQQIHGPIQITTAGPVGNQVAQPYHGSPAAALCVHLMDHYRFWSARHALLAPGSMGENLTLDGVLENEVCAGDVVQVGTAVLQVSGPRTPCANLARFLGRTDWVKQMSLRTGPAFTCAYLRRAF